MITLHIRVYTLGYFTVFIDLLRSSVLNFSNRKIGNKMDLRFTLLLVLIGVIVITANSASKPVCCMPQVYSILGGFQVGKTSGGHLTGIQGLTAVFADSDTKKVAMDNTYWINGSEKPEKNGILLDYTNKVMYVVDEETKKCTKSDLKTEWTPSCIPEGAAFMGHTYFGEKNTTNFLMTDSWWFTTQNIPVFIVTTPGDRCIPVSESYTTVDSMVTMSYHNFTTKVNPAVFDVPKECDDQKLVFSPTRARKFQKFSMFTGAFA